MVKFRIVADVCRDAGSGSILAVEADDLCPARTGCVGLDGPVQDLEVWPLGRLAGRELSDFDAFYITAQQVLRGQLDLVYRFETLTKLQAEAYNGATSFMPWTYPPQFDLLVAPFALLPTGVAYLLFVTATLTIYLLTHRAIACKNFAQIAIGSPRCPREHFIKGQ